MKDCILFFDTETTGVPKNYNARITDLDNWPRVIQLAWVLFDESGKELDSACDLIKPAGWEIPKEAFWINNGFDTEKSLAEGIDVNIALRSLLTALNCSKILVAHNISFDYPIVCAEMIRANLSSANKPFRFCTMKHSTNICQLPGPYGYKWPKLIELHKYLFGADFDGAHDALADVRATARCYFEMLSKGLIIENDLKPKPVLPKLNINVNDLI